MTAFISNDSNSLSPPPGPPGGPPDILIPRLVRFGLYIFFLSCSLLCTLFLLYHLLTKKLHRHALNNHSIVLLLLSGLLFELIDLPLQMDYLYLGYIRIQSPTLCLIWIFIEFWCHGTNSILLTWASFERHILVFHHQWISTSKLNKILFHYLPLIIIFLYTTIYYLIVIIFPSCTTIFDYNSQLCGFFPCFLINTPFLALWDAIVHNTIPTLLISFFNVTLFIRVLWQKHQLHQPIQWKKYRKMAIQLITISTWYLLIHFPMMLNVCLLLTGSMNLTIISMGPYLAYLSYYVILFMPFVCLFSMWKEVKFWEQRATVAPLNGIATNTIHNKRSMRNIQ